MSSVSNIEVWQVLSMSVTGKWALLSKWECKLLEKVNSLHANSLKGDEWRTLPWGTISTCQGSLPGLENSPITWKGISIFHERGKCKLWLNLDRTTFSCGKMFTSLSKKMQEDAHSFSAGLITAHLNSIFGRIKLKE